MAFRRLTEEQVDDAAALLLALRQRELVLEDLPEELMPDTTADIQRIIDAANAPVARPVRGWKIYCVYKPMQPIFYAPIYDLIEDGGEIPAHLSGLRLIEPEIMFRVTRPIPRREAKYGYTELSDHLTAFIGMEVVGGRFKPRTVQDAYAQSKSQTSNYGVLSDNIANNCVVVGPDIPNWRDVAFEDVRVTLSEGKRVLVDVVGGHPFDDPFLTALAGINRMRRARSLCVGDIVVTSSSTSFFPVGQGIRIRAEYHGLGAMTARFAVGEEAA